MKGPPLFALYLLQFKLFREVTVCQYGLEPLSALLSLGINTNSSDFTQFEQVSPVKST